MKKDKKELNNDVVAEKTIGDVVDVLNNVVLTPQLTSDVDPENDSWMDILNKFTSGISLGSADSRIYSQIAYKNGDNLIGDYFSNYATLSLSTNETIKVAYVYTKMARFLFDKFHTLINLLMNEFDWMNLHMQNRIKDSARNIMYHIINKIPNIDVDSIFYAIQLNAVQKRNNPYEFTEEDIEIMIAPIVNTVTANIMADVTRTIYDAFYNELVTEITSKDFDIICEYMKPYFVEFRDDLLIFMANIITELVVYRVNTTHEIYNSAKKFAEELDVPFYY